MADTLARTALWGLSGSPISGTFVFDVPGEVTWQRPEQGRTAQSPCGGPPTSLTLEAALQPRKFRLGVVVHPGANKAARVTALEALWVARGPYTLTTPLGGNMASLTVMCDPSQGGLEYKTGPYPGARTILIGFQEVA